MDRHFDDLADTLRRHMDIVGERLEMRFQVVIDGQLALRERADGSDRRHDRTEAQLANLDVRVSALEKRKRR